MISMGEEGVTPRQRASQISAGLGLVRGVVVDQHFDQRSRYGRLMSVIAPSPHLLGIGIDEDTAIVVTDRREFTVRGTRRRLRRRLHDRRHRRGRRPRRCTDARVRRHRAHPALRADLRPRRATPHRLRRAAPRPARLGRRRQGLTVPRPSPHHRPPPPEEKRRWTVPPRPAPPPPTCASSSPGSTGAATSGRTTRRSTSSSTSACSRATPPTPCPASPTGCVELLPGLENHTCSKGVRGGFVERLREGTWLGHVSEHVALQLQQEAGHDQRRGKTREVKGSTGVYNVIYGYTNEEVGLAAGRLAVRLLNHLVQEEEGFDFAAELERFLHPRRAHRVRAVDRGHPRGGGQPRHPLHPAEQRQPRAARPGRAPAADPRDDDVEDRRAGRRHRGRQGPDDPPARLGGPARAQAGDGAHGRRRGRRRPADRLPRRRQAARRQPRARRLPRPAERRRGARRLRRGRGPVPTRVRHRRVDGDRPRLPLPHRRWPDAGHRRAGARPRHRRRHPHRRRARRASPTPTRAVGSGTRRC